MLTRFKTCGSLIKIARVALLATIAIGAMFTISGCNNSGSVQQFQTAFILTQEVNSIVAKYNPDLQLNIITKQPGVSLNNFLAAELADISNQTGALDTKQKECFRICLIRIYTDYSDFYRIPDTSDEHMTDMQQDEQQIVSADNDIRVMRQAIIEARSYEHESRLARAIDAANADVGSIVTNGAVSAKAQPSPNPPPVVASNPAPTKPGMPIPGQTGGAQGDSGRSERIWQTVVQGVINGIQHAHTAPSDPDDVPDPAPDDFPVPDGD